MGLSLVYSRGCVGVESPLITIEVHLSGGLPRMSLVGLPETAVKEAKERAAEKTKARKRRRPCPIPASWPRSMLDCIPSMHQAA